MGPQMKRPTPSSRLIPKLLGSFGQDQTLWETEMRMFSLLPPGQGFWRIPGYLPGGYFGAPQSGGSYSRSFRGASDPIPVVLLPMRAQKKTNEGHW